LNFQPTKVRYFFSFPRAIFLIAAAGLSIGFIAQLAEGNELLAEGNEQLAEGNEQLAEGNASLAGCKISPFYTYLKYAAFIALCFLTGGSIFAQDKTSCKIVDEYGQPIAGALIVSEFGGNHSVSAEDGAFQLSTSDIRSAYVTASAVGYLDRRVAISDLSGDIVLLFDAHKQGSAINTGYQSFSRESLTGAVSTVKGDILDKSPTNVLSETYFGRLPGLQTISLIPELTFFGYGNTSKRIRGQASVNAPSPLIVIDGIVTPTQYYEFITPKEIESITILKDAATTAVYGIQGAGGVIVITTKRGYNGKRKVEAYADQSFQQMTKRPLHINSAQYAELRNEAGERDGLRPNSQFPQSAIEKFREGNDVYYPDNNWMDMFVKKTVLRQRAGVNVTGGNEKFYYFSNLNILNQEEPLIVNDEKDRNYDPTPRVNIVNFRSNMDIKFNDYISGYMRLAGSIKREMLSGGGMGWNIYKNILQLPPTMFGPLSPLIEDNPEMSDQVVSVDGLGNPAYGEINRSGYRQIIETNVISQAGLKADLGFITKGLSVSGTMAYQTYVRSELNTLQSYQRVVRGDDYTALDNFTKLGTAENTPLSYGKGSTFFYYIDVFADARYARRFGDHSIDAMAHTYYLVQEKETVGESNTVLPYKRQDMSLSVLYGYRDRYFLKGDLGYSGSEQFHPDHRYTATPAISGSWIVSKEDFFETADVVSLLKLRASYGITANDQTGGARFLYLDNIRSDGSEYERGNPMLQAEKIKKLNIGVDAGLLNMFTLGFDYFTGKVDNMLVNSASKIPIYQGIPLSYYPKLNEGKYENKGYEVSVGFSKQISQDFSAFGELNFMQVRNKVISVNESPYAEDYAYRYHTEGFRLDQNWGYMIDYSNGNGMFNSAEELSASGLSYSFGQPRVGDFKYLDYNNDGVIDPKDQVPLGYSRWPEQEFSFTGGLNWKNWDFSFLFHGVNKVSYFWNGIGAYEYNGKGIFSDIHLNAWTPERYAAGDKITYPALSLSQSTNHAANDFFLMNGSYLRLRNIELAYSLPTNISRKISAEKIRIALNVQNLFTVDRMLSKHVDPEIGTMDQFQPYRVYNIGLSLNF
jgi:TonB-linked SusC/RagA family outer membrane protein